MNAMIDRCAGLDVHQRLVVATVRVPGPAGDRVSHTETFGTTTTSLLALHDWLQAFGVTHVALESTGVYWKPVYHVLEDTFELLLVNTRHVHQVPGRKTDVKDSEWLAQLLECGLLRGSLVPPPALRDLRDLTRYRRKQIDERAREVQRLQKTLEPTGIKLASVVSDILGASGRAMLTALLEGTTDPTVLAELAKGRLRQKLPALREALRGRVRPAHAFLLGHILAKIDFLDEAALALTAEIDRLLRPFEATLAKLDTIPGINRLGATTILVESGGDMTRFPSAAHLCSWAAVCPGHDESAGKRRSGRTRKGNPYLRRMLVECALGATRAHGTALQARYRRIMRHRGHKKAVLAVGHQILEIAYYIMRDGVDYHELGADYFDRRHKERTRDRAVRQLRELGYDVTLAEPVAA
jgi:transposase